MMTVCTGQNDWGVEFFGLGAGIAVPGTTKPSVCFGCLMCLKEPRRRLPIHVSVNRETHTGTSINIINPCCFSNVEHCFFSGMM